MPPQQPLPEGFEELPEGFEEDTDDTTSLPEGFQLEAEQPEPKGFLETLWHAAADPLTEAPSRFAKGVADYIDDPLSRGSEAHPIKAFTAGAVEGAGNIVSGLTSPINLIAAGLTGGSSVAARAGLGGTARALTLAGRAASAPAVAHGAINLLHPESTTEERLWGVAEMAGGGAGMAQKVPTIRTKAAPKIPPREPLLLEAGDLADPDIPRYSLNNPFGW